MRAFVSTYEREKGIERERERKREREKDTKRYGKRFNIQEFDPPIFFSSSAKVESYFDLFDPNCRQPPPIFFSTKKSLKFTS